MEAKSEASRRGRSARTKGLSFERKVAQQLRHVFPDAERQLECQHGYGYDLANTGRYKIQLKAYKAYASINKIEETYSSLQDGDIPVLVTKGDRLKPMAVIPLDHWIELVAIAEGIRNDVQ